MIDRAGLAEFLRLRREMLRPADVGLPEGTRRRTPGLRREEVARLADMSADYYSRLEQRRGAHPSAPIVAALARALRCDLDGRDHLYHLAGLPAPSRRSGGYLRPGLVSLVERLVDVPVFIRTDLHEVLWQNLLAEALMGAARSRNAVWDWFIEPTGRDRCPEEDRERHSAAHVSDLRATYSRRAGEPDVRELVQNLLERSAEFRTLWERHEVAVRRDDRKRLLHPEVGLLDLTCEVLLVPEEDLRVHALFPTEGTDAREKLDLLLVLGTQDFPTTV